MNRRLIVAITGASGAIYGVRMLEVLRGVPSIETHLIITSGARATLAYETNCTLGEVRDLADEVHNENDLAANVSSGSFRTEGMVIAPCSIKTLSAVANCFSDNLVARAADVTLKERRRLVLLVRESPLHAGHLRLMTEVTASGAVVMPPMPAFYHQPQTIDDVVNQTVGRALDMFGIDAQLFTRWSGGQDAARPLNQRRSSEASPQ